MKEKTKTTIYIALFGVFFIIAVFMAIRGVLHVDAPRMTPTAVEGRIKDCDQKGQPALLYTDPIGVYAVRCQDEITPK